MIYGALTCNIIVGAALFRPLSSFGTTSKDSQKADEICSQCNKIRYNSKGLKARPKRVRLDSTDERMAAEKLRVCSESVSNDDILTYQINPSKNDLTKLPEIRLIKTEDMSNIRSSNLSLYRKLYPQECLCQEELCLQHFYTSTGSLAFMQEPQLVEANDKNIQQLIAPKEGTFCQAVAASFCCCCMEPSENVKPLFDWALFSNPLFITWVLGM